MRKILVGQVAPAVSCILAHVAQHVGELHGDAKGARMAQRPRAQGVVAVHAEHIGAHLAHAARDAFAVGHELRPGAVPHGCAVARHPVQQLVHHGRRHAILPHGRRQLPEQWALGPAGQRVAQLPPVLSEQRRHLGGPLARGEVHQVVGDTAERVQRERRPPLLGREEVAREPEGARVGAHDRLAVRCVVLEHARDRVR